MGRIGMRLALKLEVGTRSISAPQHVVVTRASLECLKMK